MTYEATTNKPVTGSFRNDPLTIVIRGPGCEAFVVCVPQKDTIEEAKMLAARIQTLLDHAYHAGYARALADVRAALVKARLW